MASKLFALAFLMVFSFVGFSQTNNNAVLFTIDDEPVKVSEFVWVYNKNLDLVKDDTQKDVDEYLKLFINYQLKLKEAKQLGLDEDPGYKKEFLGYKKQLTKTYASDNKVTDALVKEAYDRMSYDIKAKHVLIKFDESEKDTTQVYNQMLDLRQRFINEGFENLKKSVHDGRTIYAEDLGYFSGLKMDYTFESVAYNTPVGEVSMPFRTLFGYHIVKVYDKRPSRGKVTVAHIMISDNQKDSIVNSETRINEIYKKLNQGEKFESLVKQFSDDKSTSGKGGVLGTFTGGQLRSVEFEDVAFSLSDDNKISKPFKTAYGWHIVKFIKKEPLQSLEKLKNELEYKVKKDSRSKLINSARVKKLKEHYTIIENKKARQYFQSILNETFYANKWQLPLDFEKESVLFSINKKEYTYDDFGKYVLSEQGKYFGKKTPQDQIIDKAYNAFLGQTLIKYHEDNLEFENEEFAQVLNEYRNGLLLFNLMETKVWNVGVTDTVGLQNFYNDNKANYVWDDRIDAVVVTASNKKDIKKGINQINRNVSFDDIEADLNAKEQKIILTKGLMETTHQALPKELPLKLGLSETYHYNDAYHVVMIKEIRPKAIKTLDEAKGKVISDYQNHVEKNWLELLKNKYKITVNDEVLKNLKTQINK